MIVTPPPKLAKRVHGVEFVLYPRFFSTNVLGIWYRHDYISIIAETTGANIWHIGTFEHTNATSLH